MTPDRPNDVPCPPPCNRTDTTFVDVTLGHLCPEHAPDGITWIAGMSETDLIKGIHDAETVMRNDKDRPELFKAASRDHKDFDREYHRRYPNLGKPSLR